MRNEYHPHPGLQSVKLPVLPHHRRNSFEFISHHWQSLHQNPSKSIHPSVLITVCVSVPAWIFKKACSVFKPDYAFFCFLFFVLCTTAMFVEQREVLKHELHLDLAVSKYSYS